MKEAEPLQDLGGQFVDTLSRIKVAQPLWVDLHKKSVAFHEKLRLVSGSYGDYLDCLQRVIDVAHHHDGGAKDLAPILTKIYVKQRNMEGKLQTFCKLLNDSYNTPMKDKIKEWKETSDYLDTKHSKEIKKRSEEVKKAVVETERLKKKVVKKGKTKKQGQLCDAERSRESMLYSLQQFEQHALRGALTQERGHFCALVNMMSPAWAEGCELMNEGSHIQDVVTQAVQVASLPTQLPADAESSIHKIRRISVDTTFEKNEVNGIASAVSPRNSFISTNSSSTSGVSSGGSSLPKSPKVDKSTARTPNTQFSSFDSLARSYPGSDYISSGYGSSPSVCQNTRNVVADINKFVEEKEGEDPLSMEIDGISKRGSGEYSSLSSPVLPRAATTTSNENNRPLSITSSSSLRDRTRSFRSSQYSMEMYENLAEVKEANEERKNSNPYAGVRKKPPPPPASITCEPLYENLREQESFYDVPPSSTSTPAASSPLPNTAPLPNSATSPFSTTNYTTTPNTMPPYSSSIYNLAKAAAAAAMPPFPQSSPMKAPSSSGAVRPTPPTTPTPDTQPPPPPVPPPGLPTAPHGLPTAPHGLPTVPSGLQFASQGLPANSPPALPPPRSSTDNIPSRPSSRSNDTTPSRPSSRSSSISRRTSCSSERPPATTDNTVNAYLERRRSVLSQNRSSTDLSQDLIHNSRHSLSNGSTRTPSRPTSTCSNYSNSNSVAGYQENGNLSYHDNGVETPSNGAPTSYYNGNGSYTYSAQQFAQPKIGGHDVDKTPTHRHSSYSDVRHVNKSNSLGNRTSLQSPGPHSNSPGPHSNGLHGNGPHSNSPHSNSPHGNDDVPSYATQQRCQSMKSPHYATMTARPSNKRTSSLSSLNRSGSSHSLHQKQHSSSKSLERGPSDTEHVILSGQIPPGQIPPGQIPPGQIPPGQIPPDTTQLQQELTDLSHQMMVMGMRPGDTSTIRRKDSKVMEQASYEYSSEMQHLYFTK